MPFVHNHPACPDCKVTLSFFALGEDCRHYTCPCCNRQVRYVRGHVQFLTSGYMDPPSPYILQLMEGGG